MIVEKLKAVFTLDSSGFTAGMDQALKAMSDAKKELGDLNNSTRTFSNSIAGAASSIALTAGAFTGVGAAIVGTTVKLSKMSAEIDSLYRGLEFAVGGVEEATDTFDFLMKSTDRLGVSLNKSLGAFKGIAAAAKGTILEGKQVREIFMSIVEASAVLGLSSQQTELSLFAVQQMLSKGTISSEELTRQLGEHMPIALGSMAKSLGVSVSRLKEMVQSGNLLSSVVLPRFANQLRKDLANSVESASGSVRASLARLENSWFLAKKEIFSSEVNNALQEALDNITKAVDMLPGLWKNFEGAVLGSIKALGAFFKFVVWGWDLQFKAVGKLKDAIGELGGASEGYLQGLTDGVKKADSAINKMNLMGLLGMNKFEESVDEAGESIEKMNLMSLLGINKLKKGIDEAGESIENMSLSSLSSLDDELESMIKKLLTLRRTSTTEGLNISLNKSIEKVKELSFEVSKLGKVRFKVSDTDISDSMKKEIKKIEDGFDRKFKNIIFEIEDSESVKNIWAKRKAQVEEFYRDNVEYLTKGSQQELALTKKYNDLMLQIEKKSNEYILEESRKTALEMQKIADEKFFKSFGGIVDYVEGVSLKITDALTEMSLGGKVSFKELTDSILGDLQRLVYKLYVVEPIVKGFISMLREPDSGGFLGGIIGAVKNIFGFANGGVLTEPVVGVGMKTGGGYSFAEKGPEAILPLNQTGSIGGQGQVFNININAVDSRSFSDLANRNPSAIIGPIISALESGNRGLASAMRGSV